MKRAMKFFIAASLLLVGLKGFSQNLSNRGREFWVSYPFNWFFENGNSQNMVLYFSAESDATVVLTSHVYGNIWTRTYTVPAGVVVSTETAVPVAGSPLPLTPGFIPKAGTYDARLYDLAFPAGNGGQGLYDKGIHIESTTPIVAYAHYTGAATSGAAMLFPVEAYGYVYTTLNNENSYGSQPSNTYFYIMASHDNTVVEITPKVLTRAEMPAAPTGRPPGLPFTVSLNKGQSFQVISNVMAGDLSGSKIKSIANAAGECYPIAVFCGTSRTGLSCSGPGGGSGDFIMQQCFPSQAWGKRYLTSPTSNSAAPATLMTNIYRILVKDPTTVVRRNGVQLPLASLINGDYYQFNSGTADYIEADKPIMVAQYMSSAGACANTGGGGDPEMIYISPIEQAIKRIGFFRNNRENITVNYLTLIVPSGGTGLSSLTIDGIPFNSLPAGVRHSYPHPQLPGYTVIVRRWSGFAIPPTAPPGQCVVQSDSAFTAITYGLGSVESYGYNAGTLINNLNAVSSIQNTLDPTRPEHPFTCINTPVQLSVLMAYQPTRMEWKISTLGAVITPNADVINNAPVSTGTVIINGITYYKYTLPGTYSFNVADTFEIPIRTTHSSIENCNNTEEVKIQVIVKSKPRAYFNFAHTGCTLDTVYFTGVTSTTDGYTLSSWNWTLPGPVTVTGQNVQQVLQPGSHAILLTAVTAEGCASDTSRTINVNPKPTTSFTAVSPAICEDATITFTPTSTYTTPASLNAWYWDFGNGTTLTAPTGTAQVFPYPDYGNFTVKQVVKYGNLCISDTAIVVVTVYAKPRMGFDYPIGCLPVGGLVQFTSTAIIPDGQTFSNHNWNFGDPNATAGNPNTSVLQSPSHIYTAFGNYDITYSTTTNNGCTADTLVRAVFNVRPMLSFNPLAAVCQNAPVFSIANGTVTNGVPGTSVYRGPGTDDAGNFTPSIAGPGLHTIWYVFTSTAGCADSLPQDIMVYARPHADFNYPAGCLSTTGQVLFTNTSTIADAQGLTWAWNFGDPNANAGNPNVSTVQHPTHNFINGTYNINLVVSSSNGCVKDTTITAIFNITPLLTYTALNPICENAAPQSVATASVINGAIGTGSYSGPGTNAAGMFNPSLAGAGVHTITYTFTTPGGCTATATQNILVHGRPRPNFTFPSASCLPATGLATFNNISTIPDGQPMTWAWNFNDPNANAGNPNSSTLQHPSHNFVEGTYPVMLTATSLNGCVKDTTISAVFAVTPALQFPPLAPLCQNPGAVPSSIASASAINGVSGSGIYSGPGTNAAGLFDPNVAGPGIHTITYTFTSTGGCINTITNNIEVYPRPTASFIASNTNNICLGQPITISPMATVPAGAINVWNWNLGNSSAPSYTNGNPFTVTYAATNNYTVQLVVISDRGCFSQPFTQTIGVHPLPLVNFTVPTGICMPGGNASFTNQTSVPDNSVLSYQWNFGDLSGVSTATNPSYVYATPGSYSVILVATSAFGCQDQRTQVVDDFFDKPVADFTVMPQELCQGSDNVFTYNNSAPNGTIQSWNWNFGDGGTSTLVNPIKRFNNPGTYNVRLTVVNTVGCLSDPVIKPVTVHLQPVIDAGQSFVVPQGSTVQLTATANAASGLVFNWSPPQGLSDPSLLRPTATANNDQTYTLTATGEFNCTATDFVTIKILKPVKVPNIFTPNGDNIHDTWMIPNLQDYPGCSVEIFNRYGQQVFYSIGYGTPWNGTFKGKEMPLGTYYYIIQLQNGFKPITGSVTIVR